MSNTTRRNILQSSALAAGAAAFLAQELKSQAPAGAGQAKGI